MPVPGHIAAHGDPVPVQIEDVRQHHQIDQPRFFFRFPQGDRGQVAVAVGMAAELQPAIEFAVMGHQQSFAGGIDQPGRRGVVPGGTFSRERVPAFAVGNEGDEFRRGLGFLGPACGVAGQLPR